MGTPQQKSKLNEEMNTTGCKSHTERSIDPLKSRPKDKGLKGLSGKAYKAVLELRTTNYKEVAAKLLNQLSLDKEATTESEETNIKRRVYDALNVLIAMGVLQKNGKKITAKADPLIASKGQLVNEFQLLQG